MSSISNFRMNIRSATPKPGGLVIDAGVWRDDSGLLEVTLLLPRDGSTAEILHQASVNGDLTGHETMELCDYAIKDVRRKIEKHSLLDRRALTSAVDWHFAGTWVGHLSAFLSPSLGVYAVFDSDSGVFHSFHACLVKEDEVYHALPKRLGAVLFARITLEMAKRLTEPPSIPLGN